MYKATIVEDEMLVRVGIRNALSWGKIGIVLTEDAGSGEDALKIYQRERPDIILTDLRMPGMGGMALIRTIRQQDKRCRILILTCVDDFAYAQEAIEYNVTGYLLKLTMSFSEIENVIRKAVNELDQTDEGTRYVRQADRDALKEHLFKDYLFGRSCSAEDFSRFVFSYQLHLIPGQTAVGILSLNSYQSLKERYRDEKGDLIRASILNVLQELVEDVYSGEVFHDSEQYYVLLLSAPEEDAQAESRLTSLADRIEEIMKMYFGTHVSFGFSRFSHGFERLPDAYAEASETLRQQFFLNRHSIFIQSREAMLLQMKERLAPLSDDTTLNVLIDRPEREEYRNRLRTFSQRLPTPEETRIFLFSQAEYVSISVGRLWNINFSNALESFYDRLREDESLEELVKTELEYYAQLQQRSLRSNRFSAETAGVIFYLQKNYSAEISLSILAQKVHLSPNYMSNLFKREVGMKIIDYVNNLRIEQAKSLLLGSRKTTLAIAEETGFSDAAYFSRVFKKTTGFSPAEYRKLHTGYEEESS